MEGEDGVRSQVESVNSVIKRRLGDEVGAHNWRDRQVEALLKVVAYNRPSTPEPKDPSPGASLTWSLALRKAK